MTKPTYDELRRLYADNERWKANAEMMQWLMDNHTSWSWNPSPYNSNLIGGFAAFSTGYFGFDLKTAIRKAMQESRRCSREQDYAPTVSQDDG